jgi:TRAP transporter 4TM/12TM fusion protein
VEAVGTSDVPLPTAPDDELESPTRTLTGWPAQLATVLATGLALYSLYWVVGIVQPLVYRASFLLIVLVLSFLFYPGSEAASARRRVSPIDWLLVAVAVASLAWPLIDFDNFIYRAADPTTRDMALGAICILLVLEATRRTAGWVLPVTATFFILYTFYGPLLDLIGLGIIAHRGYDLARIVGTIYMTLEGIFGVPLDVAASYIILFSIYGAILGASGAGKFFLEWSMAAVGTSGGGAGPGRAVTVAGLLLGTVSGGGVANTVTLGSVAWPMLRRAGYKPEMGGAILSAAGIGAIICPPALGAAAFIIAEFLHITYLKVIVMAAIPALLYFFSIFLMIEADTRRAGAHPVPIATPPLWQLTKRHGYHFLAVVGIPIMLIFGMSPFRAVFFSMLIAVGLSFVDRENALWPRRLLRALYTGARSVLPVASTTATAGIVVGTVTLTGLGLKISGLIVDLAGGQLFLTVLYSAFAIWMLGLAVPVTASYIIAAVMVAGNDEGRRPGSRRPHVHLLLRGALGSEPANRTVSVCCRGDNKCQAGADDDADVEVHAAGVRLPVRVHAQQGRNGIAAAGAAERCADGCGNGGRRHPRPRSRAWRVDSIEREHAGADACDGGRTATVLRGNGV